MFLCCVVGVCSMCAAVSRGWDPGIVRALCQLPCVRQAVLEMARVRY